jgi:hypothetical protein
MLYGAIRILYTIWTHMKGKEIEGLLALPPTSRK